MPDAKIPHLVLDWDYDNFGETADGHFHFWQNEIADAGPEFVYASGYPSPGVQFGKEIFRRVGPFEYVRMDDAAKCRRCGWTGTIPVSKEPCSTDIMDCLGCNSNGF